MEKKEIKWVACPYCGSKTLNLEIDGGPKKPGEVSGAECLKCGKFFTIERGQDNKLYAEFEPKAEGAGAGTGTGDQGDAGSGSSEGKKKSLCKNCGAELAWAEIKNKTGALKWHPLNHKPMIVAVYDKTTKTNTWRKAYQSHFDTCPAAQKKNDGNEGTGDGTTAGEQAPE